MELVCSNRRPNFLKIYKCFVMACMCLGYNLEKNILFSIGIFIKCFSHFYRVFDLDLFFFWKIFQKAGDMNSLNLLVHFVFDGVSFCFGVCVCVCHPTRIWCPRAEIVAFLGHVHIYICVRKHIE